MPAASMIWRVMGASVQGAAHKRNGLPNQDAIAYSPKIKPAASAILALSDGHGSERCFRSQWGSEFAVQTAMEWMTKIQHSASIANGHLEPVQIKRLMEERFARDLVLGWQERVRQHLQEHPFEEQEERFVTDNIYQAYGATLLSVMVHERYILYAQLGDGDILIVTEKGEVSRPLPQDERLFANETTSLCTKNAWNDFRIGFQILTDTSPTLICAATDGYANSFHDETGFFKVGSDLLGIFKKEKPQLLRRQLPQWLDETSQAGSGDDITLGIIYALTNTP
jgi:serine/threonine protein phosphatase PrpC